MNKPRRPYEATITIGADSLRDLASALRDIVTDIPKRADRDVTHLYSSVPGGDSSNYKFEVTRTETLDHDEYVQKLDAYIAEQKREEVSG